MNKLRNLFYALLLTSAMPFTIGAEKMVTPPFLGLIPPSIAGIEDNGLVSAYANALFDDTGRGFMDHIPLPKHTFYRTLPGDPSEKWGELLIKNKGNTAAALVFSCDVYPILSADDLQNLLQDPNFKENIRAQLYQFNLKLLSLENIVNGTIPDTIDARNKILAPGETPLPYNLFALDMHSVEQFHKMQENPRIFAAALRGVIMIDNYALPLYLRFYLINHGGHSRFLALLTGDSSHEAVQKMGDRLAKEATK